MFAQWSPHSWVESATTKMLSCPIPASQTTNLLLKSVKMFFFSNGQKKRTTRNEFITVQHTEFKTLQLLENSRIKCDDPQKSTQKKVLFWLHPFFKQLICQIGIDFFVCCPILKSKIVLKPS